MKKIKYLFISIVTMLFCISNVNALTTNNDGTMTNSRGATITQEQYERLSEIFASSEHKEQKIDYLEQDQVESFTDPKNDINIQKEYFITTDTLDRYGRVINSITISASKEDAERVAENSNLHVMPNGVLQDVSKSFSPRGVIEGDSYETSSKSLELYYSKLSSGENEIGMWVVWKKIPIVKSFDVIAFRGTNIKNNINYYTAYQRSSADNTFYSENGTNTKISTNGIGVSMNLHDGAQLDHDIGYDIYLRIKGRSSYGDYIYATYQHAVSNISLATSQSYSFGSSGLGGVLVYSNGYSKYFDNMTGLKTSYTNT